MSGLCTSFWFRSQFWSELCDTDLDAYRSYLTACQGAFDNGFGPFVLGGVDGPAGVAVGHGCSADVNVSFVTSRCGGVVDKGSVVALGVGDRGGVVDSEDNCHGCFGKGNAGVTSGGPTVGSVGVGEHRVRDDRSAAGVSSVRARDASDDAEVDGRQLGSVEVDEEKVRGKHWAANRRKKEKRRNGGRGRDYCGRTEVPSWRKSAKVDASGGCVSDGSVVTVDTRTAERIEAEKTFDRRRAAENRVAEVMAKHRLASLEDVDKTRAVRDLELARMHERINKANAASQAAYAKCSDSLKSIGSAGSAGEMYYKREIARAKDNAKVLTYVKAQAEILSREATPETLARVARVPPPVFDNHEELLDCPSDADEDMIIANEFAFNEAMGERDDGNMWL